MLADFKNFELRTAQRELKRITVDINGKLTKALIQKAITDVELEIKSRGLNSFE